MRIFILSALIFLSGCSTYGQKYCQTSSTESLRLAMLHEIKPGMTTQEVQQKIGTGERPEGKQHDRAVKIVRYFNDRYPEKYPDGFQDTDVIFSYPSDQGLTVYLQYRDNRLINHDPAEFERPFQPMESLSQ